MCSFAYSWPFFFLSVGISCCKISAYNCFCCIPYVLFLFSFISNFFFILGPTDCPRICYLISTCWWNFQFSCCYFLVLYRCSHKGIQYDLILLKFANTCFVISHDLPWRIFSVHLGNVSLLLDDGLFCMCSKVWFNSNVSLLISCLCDLPSVGNGVLKSAAAVFVVSSLRSDVIIKKKNV